MIPEKSSFTCKIVWQGTSNQDFDHFTRVHGMHFPLGQNLIGAGAHRIDTPEQTNPEELFAAAVATCMMMTILAVLSKAQIPVVSYEDQPVADLELVERRFRVTRVTLRPAIGIQGPIDVEKLTNLVQKSHANCFVTLSVKSDVVVEPTWLQK
jgi:organic hydroperoxide reductase OsmC/OhrA